MTLNKADRRKLRDLIFNALGGAWNKFINDLPDAEKEEPTFRYQHPKSCIGCRYITESLACTISEKNCTRREIKEDYYHPR